MADSQRPLFNYHFQMDQGQQDMPPPPSPMMSLTSLLAGADFQTTPVVPAHNALWVTEPYVRPKYDYVVLEMFEVFQEFESLYPSVLTKQSVLELYRQLFDKMQYDSAEYFKHIQLGPNFMQLQLNQDTPDLRKHIKTAFDSAAIATYLLVRDNNLFQKDQPDNFPYFLELPELKQVILRSGYDYKLHPGHTDV